MGPPRRPTQGGSVDDAEDPASGSRAGPINLILGTAGHIDHGKTALVKALTGVDTDRLPEEKERGITIDLGFAPLELADGLHLSVVDVPGHERLVRTMVAGASGIDLLLLVVAADEGVMPQTREHLAICELLGLTRAVVALTKIDLVEPDLAELAAEEVSALLDETPLAGASVVPVSALRGDGIEILRASLVELASKGPPRTPRSGPPRLAIDRAFEMRGFGSVVTGTLVGGSLAVGDAVKVHPGGPTSRVRGIQHHGAPVERAEPGGRCALNLHGVGLEALSRGQVISPPEALPSVSVLDVELVWLASAPEGDGPTSVEFLSGTAERRARVAPIGAKTLVPGEAGWARIHIDAAPVAALPGDRFVLRGFARTQSGATLGGGRILDVKPPRRRRSDPALARELAALARAEPESDLRIRIERRAFAGARIAELQLETGLAEQVFRTALDALVLAEEVLLAGRALAVDAAAVAELERRLLPALDAFHTAQPLRPGMPVAALRGALPANAAPEATELALSRLAAAGSIAVESDLVRRTAHRAALAGADLALADRICAALTDAALEPPSVSDLARRLEAPADGLSDLLGFLEHDGRVVRAPGDLFFDAEAVAALRARVREHFERDDTLDTQTYKALIGTTRRTAMPLMELLDAEHLTVRRGEIRRLRTR